METQFTCNLCKKSLDVKDRATFNNTSGQFCKDCFKAYSLGIASKRPENPIKRIPEIESVLIKDFYIIRKADIKFSPGLNIIVGKNASGKTTVVNYLVMMSDPNIMSEGNKLMFAINNKINKVCLLIDDVLCRLDNEFLIKILKNLETCNRQVIATLDISQWHAVKDKINANIIKTEDFELKEPVDIKKVLENPDSLSYSYGMGASAYLASERINPMMRFRGL